MKRAIVWLLGTAFIATAAPAHAQVPTHATVLSWASATWDLGPAGGGRVRHAGAFYYEKNQNGEVREIAALHITTCRRRQGLLDRCRTEHSVTHEDFDPVFLMDPTMQLATLELGPHRVEWHSGGRPGLTFIEVTCDPDSGQYDRGPQLARETEVRAEMFGRPMETKSNGSDRGLLVRGALVSRCSWR